MLDISDTTIICLFNVRNKEFNTNLREMKSFISSFLIKYFSKKTKVCQKEKLKGAEKRKMKL
jgi:hypothetical protein